MEDKSTPLVAILGPIVGAILLVVVINLGVSYLRQGQVELKEEARREQAAAKFGIAEEDAAAPESEVLSDTVPAAQDVTATDSLPVTTSETITSTDAVTVTETVTP